jgi:quercetin dioxygenase-like cupin family protein
MGNMRSSRAASLIAVVAAMGIIIMPTSTAFAQQLPPGVLVEKRFQADNPPGPFDVVQLVLDLAPDAATPTHSHGGQVFLTVLEGTLWERSGGVETTLVLGETLTEHPGRVHAAGNSRDISTELLVTVLLPKGAALTTLEEGGPQASLPPGPTVLAQAQSDGSGVPAVFDVVQRVTEIAPGGAIPMHTHPGPNFVILLQGQMTLNMDGMAPQTFRVGDNWVEPANVVHGATNSGSEPVRFVGSVLVPRGAPASTPAAQPAAAAAPAVAPAPAAAPAPAQAPRQLPRTGELATGASSALVLGFMLLAGGAVARRWRL